MSERGFVAVDRGIFDHPVFTDEPKTEREAWIWIIANASWAPQQKRVGSQVLDLQRGQLGCSLRFLAKAWMWSESRVRRFLAKLQSTQMIDAVSTQMATQITVCNYNAYQQSRRSSDADTDAVATQTITKKQKTTSSEANASSSAPARDDVQEAFDAWNGVARRNGLPVAERLTKDRRGKIKARLSEANGLDGWGRAMARLEASDFCTGRKTDFRATLDFVLQPSSFTKLIEGAYDNNPHNGSRHEPTRTGPQPKADQYRNAFDRIRDRNGVDRPSQALGDREWEGDRFPPRGDAYGGRAGEGFDGDYGGPTLSLVASNHR